MNIENVKSLHIELTSLCNAGCPMCLRTASTQYYNKDFVNIEYLKDMIRPIATQLEHIYFCGSVGDPLASKHLLDLCGFIKDLNSHIWISCHTNGGLRNPDYYQLLAKICNRVVFSIDGLQDTNSIYRIGVDWHKLMANAQMFIKHGQMAEWHYLVFEHNEHQIAEAQQLSQQLGFRKFIVKKSNRFNKDSEGNSLPYVVKGINGSYELKASNITLPFSANFDSQQINCMSLDKGELYVDHLGHVLPCCYLGVDLLKSLKGDIGIGSNQFKDLGNIQSINLKNYKLEDILSSEFFQKIWQSRYTLKTCKISCGDKTPKSQYRKF